MIAQTEEDLENADTITLREVAKRYNCRESDVFSLQINVNLHGCSLI